MVNSFTQWEAHRMATHEDVRTWRGRDVVDREGEKVGKLEDIYLDRQSGEPEWAAIRTGLFGTKVSFAPIRDASPGEDEVRIAYTKAQVKDAPNIDADGELSPEEERQLYTHYGRDYADWTETSEDRTAGTVGRDVSGPMTDDAMTRSEEELRVGKAQRETGRARLRKYVVTEEVQQTVPVQREEVRIEREPITDANREAAMAGPEISEEEHEVTLHAEEPVVEKRAVPKERVRLDKDRVTEERQVDEEVRKERIEGEGGAEDRI
jgi:uncharacterized protein (TIGR02271 family)